MRIIRPNECHSCVGCLVLHQLPEVMGGRDIGIVVQVDGGQAVVPIRVGEEAVCPCHHLQVSPKPGDCIINQVLSCG